ncbi:MAG TPA: hypothetical protein VFW87_06675, partial [Pirellulales bacterium]|nr:hypothetical protein [Pirellulales bacterium]
AWGVIGSAQPIAPDLVFFRPTAELGMIAENQAAPGGLHRLMHRQLQRLYSAAHAVQFGHALAGRFPGEEAQREIEASWF